MKEILEGLLTGLEETHKNQLEGYFLCCMLKYGSDTKKEFKQYLLDNTQDVVMDWRTGSPTVKQHIKDTKDNTIAIWTTGDYTSRKEWLIKHIELN